MRLCIYELHVKTCNETICILLYRGCQHMHCWMEVGTSLVSTRSLLGAQAQFTKISKINNQFKNTNTIQHLSKMVAGTPSVGAAALNGTFPPSSQQSPPLPLLDPWRVESHPEPGARWHSQEQASGRNPCGEKYECPTCLSEMWPTNRWFWCALEKLTQHLTLY